MTKASDKKSPLQTEKTLTDSALEKLRKANEAAQRASETKVKLDKGFSPQAAGFSPKAWAALSLSARYDAITAYIAQRQTELKQAREAETAKRAQA